MTRSKVNHNGEIVWGLFEKVMAWVIIAFFVTTLSSTVTTAVLVFQVEDLEDDHNKDMAMMREAIVELKDTLVTGSQDQYTGTQATADRTAAIADRTLIRARVDANAAALADLQVAVAKLEAVLEDYKQ